MAREGPRDMMASSRQPLAIYEHIRRIKKLMRGFGNREAICSHQCEQLIVSFQEQSDRVLAIINPLDPYILSPNDPELLTALVDRFICNMEAVEDLLYLCSEVDWKVAALSVFPSTCDPEDSNFALLVRDLDRTYSELQKLLRPRAGLNFGPLKGYNGVRKLDFFDVLLKLAPTVESRQGSIFSPSPLQRYASILRMRLRLEAQGSRLGYVPYWCWILENLAYSIVGVVGSGSSKSVLKCQWLGMDVAIAVFKGEHAETNLETEAGILASVQHPNVVTLFGCTYDEEKKEGHLVMELMEQDLRELIRSNNDSRRQGDPRMPFSLSVSKDIILQIVGGTIHMRKCRVLHRDLKPANCLVRAKKRLWQNDRVETYYVVKLIDFGSAKVPGPEASTCHTRKQGTTAYMAPELHAMPDECSYKWSADVYSLGMTMYEILSGMYPFEGVYTGGELVRRVCAGERPLFPEWVPGDWRLLIEDCWHPDPIWRPDIEDVQMRILKCTSSLNI